MSPARCRRRKPCCLCLANAIFACISCGCLFWKATRLQRRRRRERVFRSTTAPCIFGDDNLQVSQAYHWTLQLGERQRRHRVAWDIFLLYRAGVRWEEAPPAPDFWMHQLFLEDVPKLDVDTLKYELEQTLRGA